MPTDSREDMDVFELLDELEVRFPEEVSEFEERHPDAMAAVADEDLSEVDDELLDALVEDLRERLQV